MSPAAPRFQHPSPHPLHNPLPVHLKHASCGCPNTHSAAHPAPLLLPLTSALQFLRTLSRGPQPARCPYSSAASCPQPQPTIDLTPSSPVAQDPCWRPPRACACTGATEIPGPYTIGSIFCSPALQPMLVLLGMQLGTVSNQVARMFCFACAFEGLGVP